MSDQDIRSRLAETIQSTSEDDDSLDGAMLMGFVVIGEWMDPQGSRWLSVTAGNPHSEPLPDWTVQGYLDNVLHDWQPVLTDDDDDD